LRQHIPKVTRLSALACLITAATACGVSVEGDDPPRGVIYEPVGLALHPANRYLYVVNSNFSLNYRRDRGGSVVVVDTDTLELLPNSGVQIGTFGGEIALNSPANGEPTRAYVTVRGDRSLVALDLSDGGARLRCGGGVLTAACALSTGGEDPFALSVRTLEFNVQGQPTQVDLVAVAHLLGEDVAAFAIRGDDLRSFNRVSSPLIAGAGGIARSPRTNQFYVTGRFEGAVVSFRPVFSADGEVEGLFETGSATIDRASPFSGVDSRGIAFNKAGTMAFVANRAPDSLLFVDVGPADPQTGAGARNRVVDALTMPSAPASVLVVEVAPGRELVYVTAYDEEEVIVIDPQTRAIVDAIELPSGGYSMAADTQRHKRLYVSLFEDDQIGVIDLDPDAEGFHTVTEVFP
jgi:DNA-binding beta-propeller fold protein YncE